MNVSKFLEMKKALEEKCQLYNEKSGESFSLSISMGCVEYDLDDDKADIEKLLAIADDELYKEKQLKYRNRRISNQVL